MRARLLWIFLALVAATCVAGKAMADLLSAFFPDDVPGYNTDNGVTVRSRLHPELMPVGLRDGAFLFQPRLDESFGYSSNVLPGAHRRGSWQVVTAPSLGIASDWGQDALGAALSVADTRTPSAPSQDRTDATASVGARFDFGRDQLTVAAAHIAQHEDRGQVDTIASDRPIAVQIDDVRASYVAVMGAWRMEPGLEVARWTYGDTTIQGIPASQSYRDRISVNGTLTLRYELAPLRSLLLVVRGIGQDYMRMPVGQGNPDSIAYQMLGGIDYDDDSVWHWRLLSGGETRTFMNRRYPARNTFIAEAAAGWSPSSVTTVGATIARTTEDAAQAGVSGLVYSTAALTIDHEVLRDLLFTASAGLQRADFFQGGYQVSQTAGVGLVWTLNRSVRLSLTFNQTDLRGSSAALTNGYSRSVGLVTLRLGL